MKKLSLLGVVLSPALCGIAFGIGAFACWLGITFWPYEREGTLIVYGFATMVVAAWLILLTTENLWETVNV